MFPQKHALWIGRSHSNHLFSPNRYRVLGKKFWRGSNSPTKAKSLKFSTAKRRAPCTHIYIITVTRPVAKKLPKPDRLSFAAVTSYACALHPGRTCALALELSERLCFPAAKNALETVLTVLIPELLLLKCLKKIGHGYHASTRSAFAILS